MAFMWQRSQQELLDEMIGAGVEAIVIKVPARTAASSRMLN